MTLRDQIVSELTQLDARKGESDPHWNRYFIGLALQAMEGFENDVSSIGADLAYAERFTPTRETAAIARKVGLALKVDSGRWVLPNGKVV